MQYPYLIWSVMFGLIWAVVFALRKDLRKEMLYISLILAPLGATNFLFIPEYWNPVVVYKFFGIFDIESIMHMFFLGGLAAVMYEAVFGYYHTTARIKGKSVCRHRGICNKSSILVVLATLAVFLVFIRFFTTLSVLRSAFVFTILFIVFILISRKDLIKESIFGGIVFMLFYIISLLFVDFIFGGGFIEQWSPTGTLFYFLGVPIEEYAYSLLFGMLGSILYEDMEHITLKRK